MTRKCCVPNCYTDNSGTDSLFSFPFNDPVRLKEWVNAIGLNGWVPVKNSRICSKHFSPDSFHNKRRLFKFAIPLTITHSNKSSPVKKSHSHVIRLNNVGVDSLRYSASGHTVLNDVMRHFYGAVTRGDWPSAARLLPCMLQSVSRFDKLGMKSYFFKCFLVVLKNMNLSKMNIRTILDSLPHDTLPAKYLDMLTVSCDDDLDSLMSRTDISNDSSVNHYYQKIKKHPEDDISEFAINAYLGVLLFMKWKESTENSDSQDVMYKFNNSDDLPMENLNVRAYTVLHSVLTLSDIPFDFALSPYMELHILHSNEDDIAFLKKYVAKHEGHFPALKFYYDYVKTNYPSEVELQLSILKEMKDKHYNDDEAMLDYVDLLMENHGDDDKDLTLVDCSKIMLSVLEHSYNRDNLHVWSKLTSLLNVCLQIWVQDWKTYTKNKPFQTFRRAVDEVLVGWKYIFKGMFFVVPEIRLHMSYVSYVFCYGRYAEQVTQDFLKSNSVLYGQLKTMILPSWKNKTFIKFRDSLIKTESAFVISNLPESFPEEMLLSNYVENPLKRKFSHLSSTPCQLRNKSGSEEYGIMSSQDSLPLTPVLNLNIDLSSAKAKEELDEDMFA